MKSFRNFLVEKALKNYIEVSTKNPDADFWIVRRGSENAVGEPVKKYNPEHFGITVTRKDLLMPDYLYYAMLNVYNQGYYKPLARGTLKMVNIRKDDILSIPIG